MAENAHHIWAEGRLAEGWTYGPERNDHDKTHPDLLPYEKLTGSEKEYDRRASMETLKAIVSLGYKIVPATRGTGPACRIRRMS